MIRKLYGNFEETLRKFLTDLKPFKKIGENFENFRKILRQLCENLKNMFRKFYENFEGTLKIFERFENILKIG